MSERTFSVCDCCDNPIPSAERLSPLLVDLHGTGEDLVRLDFCLACSQNVVVLDVTQIAFFERGAQLSDDSRKRVEELRKRMKAYKR